MQVNEIKNEGLEVQFRVTIPTDELDKIVNEKLQELSKTVKLPGFRPGKVPMKIVSQKYKSSVHVDVTKKEIEKHVQKLVKDQNLKLATQPIVEDIKFEEDKDAEFTVILEKMPEIKDIDFGKIKLEKVTVKIEDKDIDERINKLASSKKSYKKAAKTYKAKQDDKVMIDFEGFVDGEAFEGGKAENFGLVLGSNSFIEGFETQLIGAKASDEITVKVTFPKEYHADNLAGKDSEFKVKIHEVQKAGEVEINDDLAKEFGLKDLEELKKNLREYTEKSFDEPIFTYQKLKLFDQLEGSLDFDVPQSLLEQERKVLESQLKQYKEQDPEIKKMTDKELDEYINKVSLRRVRIGLMLADYADKNSIKVTQDDLRGAIIDHAKSFPGQEQAIIEFYQKNPNATRNLSGPIIEDKSVKDIIENKVQLKEKEYSIDKFNKLMEDLESLL